MRYWNRRKKLKKRGRRGVHHEGSNHYIFHIDHVHCTAQAVVQEKNQCKDAVYALAGRGCQADHAGDYSSLAEFDAGKRLQHFECDG